MTVLIAGGGIGGLTLALQNEKPNTASTWPEAKSTSAVA